MRMDTSQTKTARELINNLSYSELREIINKNSDERFAARIAASIVDHRPLQNTLELAELIKKRFLQQQGARAGIQRSALFRPFAWRSMMR